jgi:hypothetical protein
MQPGIVEVAFRHAGSIRDFARAPERLGTDDNRADNNNNADDVSA